MSDEDHPLNVLFLCTGNSARSIIAEAIMNREGRGRFRAFSAGSHPKGEVNPHAIGLLRSLHYPVDGFRSKPWDEFEGPDAPKLDFVFTVCDDAAAEVCPIWPGQPMTAHWGMPDPAAAQGSPAEIALAFADTYRIMNNRITLFMSLPMASLDKLSLQQRLDEIGRRREACADGMRNPAAAGDASLEPPLETFGLAHRLAAEALGTALLLAVVVGSGIMGERLAAGNDAIALLGNTLATGAGLVVLITIFGPISGAHFNPAVTLAFAIRREIAWARAAAYVVVQVLAGIVGVWLAHAMFAEPILQVSQKLRDGPSQALAEFVATFGLIGSILGSLRFRPDATPWIVGLYITAAYWFTASTSFANPAVTIARSLSNTFAGIAPSSAPAFIVAQLAGAVVAGAVFGWLLGGSPKRTIATTA